MTSATLEFQSPKWQKIAIIALAFWLSTSLLLDLVIMPCLYGAGMMATTTFATVGYSLFWAFNRLEVICAAVVLTSLLVLVRGDRGVSPGSSPSLHRWALPLSGLLLLITLVYTYGLAPQMSALGMQLNLFESSASPSIAMLQMQGSYWGLEVIKLISSGVLLGMVFKKR